MRDQIAGELERMAAAYNVYAAVRLYRTWPKNKLGEFAVKYPDTYELLKETWSLQGG